MKTLCKLQICSHESKRLPVYGPTFWTLQKEYIIVCLLLGVLKRMTGEVGYHTVISS